MSSPTPSSQFRFPGAVALGLAIGAAGVVWSLVQFWGTSPEYTDRFLVLLGAAWAAWRVRPDLAALPARPTPLGYVPLVLGAAAFPVGWFLQAQVAPRPVLLWWLTLAWVATAAGAVLLGGGRTHLRRLAFPLLFALFALPIPNRVLVPLQTVLQSATTAAAAAALPALGVPVERSGFVLSLPGGDLGVAEACSGVRSVTALVAIAAFVAHLRGFGPVRGLVLLGLSVPVIAAVNAVRVILSGLIMEHAGARFIRGDWHEALGVAMVLLGLGLVVGLARVLGGPSGTPDRTATTPEPRPPAPARGAMRFAAVLIVLSLVATVAAQFLGADVERETVAVAPLEEIPARIGPWSAVDAPIPDYVSEMLTYDAAVHRVYSRDLGYEVDVWMIFWSSRNMVKGYHHPDVCWPNRGFRVEAREVVPVPIPGGSRVPVTVRQFRRGSDRHLVLYWTQEGRRVWTEEDEKRVRMAGDSHDWVGERLLGRDRAAPSGRLVVLMGTPTSGDGRLVREQTLAFAGSLAEALYKVCPWAALQSDAHQSALQ